MAKNLFEIRKKLGKPDKFLKNSFIKTVAGSAIHQGGVRPLGDEKKRRHTHTVQILLQSCFAA